MRLTHPPWLVLTDTPGKLNNLVTWFCWTRQEGSPELRAGACWGALCILILPTVGFRRGAGMPQLLTKKPLAFEHQRRRVCCLIKGRIKQDKESTSLVSLIGPVHVWSGHQAVFWGCPHPYHCWQKPDSGHHLKVAFLTLGYRTTIMYSVNKIMLVPPPKWQKHIM